MNLCRPVYLIWIALPLIWQIAYAQTSAIQEAGDNRSYPNVRRYLEWIDLEHKVQTQYGLQHRDWCDANRFVELSEDQIGGFFLAGIRDQLTVIRLLVIASEHLKARDIALCGTGDTLARALRRRRINLGLSLPLEHLALYAWTPVYDSQDVFRIASLKLVYNRPFLHRFSDLVLPADLKIGTGKPVTYARSGETPLQGYRVTMDLYRFPDKIGLDHIQGIGGRPHGFLGTLMDWFPFIPDNVHSMYLQDNILSTKALVTTRVREFETTPAYRMYIERR